MLDAFSMSRSAVNLLALALIGLGLCWVSQCQRMPMVTEDHAIRFPLEQDIRFPGEPPGRRKPYRIADFRFDSPESIPWPRGRPPGPPPGPPPRPGDPFPPPPRGSRSRPRRPNRQRRVSETKYSEYVERIFPNNTAVVADANDDDFDGRILAKPGEYPHMAAVGFEETAGQIEYKCGGSLISEHFVLTAAHCTALRDMTPKWVRLGDLNLMIDENTVEPQVFQITSIHNHPEYDEEFYYYDISLLRLNHRVNFTEFVRPIRLWVSNELPTSLAFAIGYGATSLAKAMSNRLTDLNLTILHNEDCATELPALSEAPNGVIDSQLCAQDYILNRDTCQGDSGGPLQLNLPGRRSRRIHYHLIGITSYGVFCRSSFPSVYTRVSSFLDWIERVVWNAN